MIRYLALPLLLVACQPAASKASASGAAGPVIWTIPVVDSGGESELAWEGQTLQLATARSWPSDSVAVEFLGTESLLQVDLADDEIANWSVYSQALHGSKLLVRIADVDVAVLDMHRDLPAEGLWPLGPRETAEPRGRALMAALGSN